ALLRPTALRRTTGRAVGGSSALPGAAASGDGGGGNSPASTAVEAAQEEGEYVEAGLLCGGVLGAGEPVDHRPKHPVQVGRVCRGREHAGEAVRRDVLDHAEAQLLEPRSLSHLVREQLLRLRPHCPGPAAGGSSPVCRPCGGGWQLCRRPIRPPASPRV
ncbi:unnamed protein product, partial [Ectocarpus sp. 4 AP-2014]